jgi:hypothetical protein
MRLALEECKPHANNENECNYEGSQYNFIREAKPLETALSFSFELSERLSLLVEA